MPELFAVTVVPLTVQSPEAVIVVSPEPEPPDTETVPVAPGARRDGAVTDSGDCVRPVTVTDILTVVAGEIVEVPREFNVIEQLPTATPVTKPVELTEHFVEPNTITAYCSGNPADEVAEI